MPLLTPHAVLWRGVKTRGPSERACTSAGVPQCRLAAPLAPCQRGSLRGVLRRRLAPSQASYEAGAAALQLPTSSLEQALSSPPASPTASMDAARRSHDADDAPRDSTASRGDGQLPSASSSSSSKVLKINIDLMLWRCRTARIRARLTLDSGERKALYKAAEDGLRRCLALDPADPRAYVVLGKTLLQQKRYDEARALYQEGCINTGNTNPYIWSAWGWLEAATGNADRARKLYDAAVVVDATHACAWHKWGSLEKGAGNFTRARDLWMQGIQRCRRKPQSQNAYLYNALGCMAAQLGRTGEARAWFEEGTRSAEGAASVALWQAWAVLEAKQGDPSAVRYLFRRALAANPRSRYVHLAWALWERKQGNARQCLALLQRGAQLNPTDSALYQAWALVEKQAGRIERARELLERGLKADPSHLHLWQAYGIMEAEQGNLDKARQLFQEGVWADPRSPATVFVFHAWGSLEWRAGNVQTARELFRAAVRVDPKSETTWSSWVAMEAEAGFVDRAEELRIRQAEKAWEWAVPAGFTTRPAPGVAGGLAAGTLGALADSIGDTLSRFFSARGLGGGGGGGGDGGAGVEGAARPTAAVEEGGGRLRLEDIQRLVEDGDLSALPDPVADDDGLEAAIRPPRNNNPSSAASGHTNGAGSSSSRSSSTGTGSGSGAGAGLFAAASGSGGGNGVPAAARRAAASPPSAPAAPKAPAARLLKTTAAPSAALPPELDGFNDYTQDDDGGDADGISDGIISDERYYGFNGNGNGGRAAGGASGGAAGARQAQQAQQAAQPPPALAPRPRVLRPRRPGSSSPAASPVLTSVEEEAEAEAAAPRP